MKRHRTLLLPLGVFVIGAIVGLLIITSVQKFNQQYIPKPTGTTATGAITPQPIRCEVRNTYAWTLNSLDDKTGATVRLAKGTTAKVTSQVAVRRSLVSSTTWCGVVGGTLARCDDTCPPSTDIITVGEESTVVTASVKCPTIKGITCSSSSTKAEEFPVTHGSIVTKTVAIANTAATCATKTATTLEFVLKDGNAKVSTLTRLLTETCPKPVPKPAPKPKAAPRPAPKIIYISKTVDYWLDRPSLLGRYLPISIGGGIHEPRVVDSVREAQNIMAYGHSVDGIWRLAAQLVTAKLNIKSGASVPSNACLVRGDALFDKHKYNVWRLLSEASKQELNACANSLAAYNSRVKTPR